MLFSLLRVFVGELCFSTSEVLFGIVHWGLRICCCGTEDFGQIARDELLSGRDGSRNLQSQYGEGLIGPNTHNPKVELNNGRQPQWIGNPCFIIRIVELVGIIYSCCTCKDCHETGSK